MSDSERQVEVGLYGVTKRFGDMVAVDDVTIEVARGEFFSLLGPSGCGKTTSLRMIAGFEEPDEGRVVLTGQDIVGVPPFKRNVNTVFQSYALFPHLTVADNVAFGLGARRSRRATSRTGSSATSTSCSCRATTTGGRRSSPAASNSASPSLARS